MRAYPHTSPICGSGRVEHPGAAVLDVVTGGIQRRRDLAQTSAEECPRRK